MSGDAKHDALKRGTAILVACLIESMEEDARERFVANLDRAYAKMRDEPHDKALLELLSWTRTLVTGFSFADGPGTPFLRG